MENKNNHKNENRNFKDIVQEKLLEYSKSASQNAKTCSSKCKIFFETAREKLHRLTYSTKDRPELKYNTAFKRSNFNKKFKYKKVSFGETTYFSEDDRDIEKNNLDGITYYFPVKDNPKNFDQTKYIFDGKTIMWINSEAIELFPRKPDHHLAINILKPKKKYCLVARSKLIKNIPITQCITINGKQLTKDLSNYMKKEAIIMCKRDDWSRYVLGKIICINIPSIQNKNTPILFDVLFPSCPESEIVIAWHNDSSIKENTTVIRYNYEVENINYINNSLREEKENLNEKIKSNTINNFMSSPHATPLTSPELEALAIEPDENMPNLTLELNESIETNSVGAFCIDDLNESVNEIRKQQEKHKNETIKSREPSPEPSTNQLLQPSAKFIRKCKNAQVLLYNAYWLKNQPGLIINKTNNQNIIYKRKQIVVADTSCSENFKREFLDNIKILTPLHFRNIFKIQKAYGKNMKVISLRNKYYISKIDNRLEPQNLRGFEFTTSPNKIAHALNNKLFCTYTGPLCYEAKKYLFSLN